MSLEFSLKNIDVRQNEIKYLYWKFGSHYIRFIQLNFNIVKYFEIEKKILSSPKMNIISAQED